MILGDTVQLAPTESTTTCAVCGDPQHEDNLRECYWCEELVCPGCGEEIWWFGKKEIWCHNCLTEEEGNR